MNNPGPLWRFLLADRFPNTAVVADLEGARSRSLHFDLNAPSTCQFTVDGRVPGLKEMTELEQDIAAYRWTGHSWQCMFRGPIGNTEDQLTGTSHTTNINAADYRAMLGRRLNGTINLTYTNIDQAQIVSNLVQVAMSPPGGWPHGNPAGAPFDIGLRGHADGSGWAQLLGPEGLPLATTGQIRTRTYTGGETIGSLLDNLSNVLGGFEYAVLPFDPITTRWSGQPTVWYDHRGIVQTNWVAEYGSTIRSCTRSVQTSDFGNLIRYTGQADTQGNSPPAVYATVDDVWQTPAAHPEGFWEVNVSAPDVSLTATLSEQAQGALDDASLIQPSYTLNVAAGTWTGPLDCWLGDTITLKIKSGRLDVNTQIRILAVDVTISDEGTEAISLTVGRPAVTLKTLFTNAHRRLDQLERA